MKIGFIIDNLNSFDILKDSTYMLLKAVQDRGWDIYIFYFNNLFILDSKPKGDALKIIVNEKKKYWYKILFKHDNFLLLDLDCIFMRKDPPFNMEYIYVTYILDLLKLNNILVVNDPQSLRNFNEKVSIINYLEYTPHTLITRNYKHINQFYIKYKDIIVKPLDNMAGNSIFRIKNGDKNKNVILETITNYQTKYIMVQNYQKDIKYGDKRILIVNGRPIKHILIRIPNNNDNRGNIAANAKVKVKNIEDNDYKIAKEIAKKLKNNGIIFAGIDMIGNKLTEINITSPTGIQEIYKATKVNVANLLIQEVEQKINKVNKEI